MPLVRTPDQHDHKQADAGRVPKPACILKFFRCPLNGVLTKVSEALFCQRISKLGFEITSEWVLGGTLQMNIA